jgi:hypothetical protein
MNRLVAIAFDLAIFALIGISLFSNGPLFSKAQVTTATRAAPAVTDALAEQWPH